MNQKQKIQMLEAQVQDLSIKLRSQITTINNLREKITEKNALVHAYTLLLKQNGIKTGREGFEVKKEQMLATKYAAQATGRSVSSNDVQAMLF
jgi:thioredoxin-related protein